jgi:hypothetical protein
MTVLVKARSNLPNLMEQNISHYQSAKPRKIPVTTDPISKSDKTDYRMRMHACILCSI